LSNFSTTRRPQRRDGDADSGAEVVKVETARAIPTRQTFAGSPHLEGNPVFEFENLRQGAALLDTQGPGVKHCCYPKDAERLHHQPAPTALKRANSTTTR